MAATAAVIKITSPGPLIFKQERIGFQNRPFLMYKFRSMVVQDEKKEKERDRRRHREMSKLLATVVIGQRILGQHGVLGPSIYQEGDGLPPDFEGYPGFRGGLLTLTSLVT